MQSGQAPVLLDDAMKAVIKAIVGYLYAGKPGKCDHKPD
jgi:hypothetical protein